MKSIGKNSVVAGLLWVGLILMLSLSCDFNGPTDYLPNQISGHVVEPGKKYTVVFPDSTLDKLQSIPDDSLVHILLEPMFRPVAIIKADNFLATYHEGWSDFLNFVTEKKYRVGLGLIANTLLYADDKGIQLLKTMNKFQFELYLNGWDHYVTEDQAEFDGTSLQDQINRLEWSLQATKKFINYTPHTFAAPENRYDSLTAVALRHFPEIIIWLFGEPQSGLFILPHTVTVENDTGAIISMDEFVLQYTIYKSQPAIVLEIHPKEWDNNQYKRFEAIIQYLTRNGRRLATPFGYYTWQQDQSRITMYRSASNSVILDCTNCLYAHDLVFLIPPKAIYALDIGVPD